VLVDIFLINIQINSLKQEIFVLKLENQTLLKEILSSVDPAIIIQNGWVDWLQLFVDLCNPYARQWKWFWLKRYLNGCVLWFIEDTPPLTLFFYGLFIGLFILEALDRRKARIQSAKEAAPLLEALRILNFDMYLEIRQNLGFVD
jgi:hypothetical protein